MERAKAIEGLLEHMVELVDSESPWRDKKDALKAAAKSHPRWETALDEILSWFSSGIGE